MVRIGWKRPAASVDPIKGIWFLLYPDPGHLLPANPKCQGTRLLEKAFTQLGLSVRAHDRVLRMARTIADLRKGPSGGRTWPRLYNIASGIRNRFNKFTYIGGGRKWKSRLGFPVLAMWENLSACFGKKKYLKDKYKRPKVVTVLVSDGGINNRRNTVGKVCGYKTAFERAFSVLTIAYRKRPSKLMLTFGWKPLNQHQNRQPD